MSRSFICVGDSLDHGGSVVTGSPFTDICGKPVSRVNDQVVCSQHGAVTIVTGDATLIIDGQPVARHGDKTSCGATLISSQVTTFTDPGSAQGASTGGATVVQAATTASRAAAAAAAMASSDARFDEQIRFVAESGVALSGVSYRLHLEDGGTERGTTDGSGHTSRIVTAASTRVVQAELEPPDDAEPCCSQGDGGHDAHADVLVIDLENVQTNETDVGSSVKEVKAKAPHERPLTQGEIEMARLVFSDAIDYGQVKIHNHGYWLLFGFQPDDTAVAPNGEIYLPKDIYSDDFSSARLAEARLFIHEMTHVWQYQLGYAIRRTRAVRPNMPYDYVLDEEKQLCDYNMEAQGNILADYFLLEFRNAPNFLYERQYANSAGAITQYRRALDAFLRNPGSKENLPNVTR